MGSIGPYSRPFVLAKLDGRTREAGLLGEVRADLTAHVGGDPSATQRRLIEVAAGLSLRIAALDARTAAGAALTDCEANTYTRACAALSATLRDLGPQGSAERAFRASDAGRPAA